MRGVPGYLAGLDKVFVVTSLIGCLAWLLEYTRNAGWRNAMGRTLLTKTSLLAGLLLLSAVSFFVRLAGTWLLLFTWAGVLMLGAIGPVMIWRMLVFGRLSHGVRYCPNGHRNLLIARYCSVCGAAMQAGPPAD